MNTTKIKRICIDGRMLGYGGIGRYLENLLLHFQKLNQDRYQFQVVKLGARPPLFDDPRFTWIDCPAKVYSLRQHWLFSRFWRQGHDLYFFPHFDLPLLGSNRRGPAKVVVTIHDLLYLRPGLNLGFFQELYTKFMLAQVQKTADAVITDSEVSKQDIRHWFAPEKITVVSLGGLTTDSMAPGPAGPDLPRAPLAVYCGNAKQHKNIAFMFDMFAEIMQRTGRVTKLLCLGFALDELSAEVRRRCEPLLAAGQIECRGKIDDRELLNYYRQAHLVFLLSKYEGFGLPVVEALCCGTPAVVLNTSGMNTYFTEGVISVPEDSMAAAGIVAGILSDPAAYDRLSRAGREHAVAFQWQRTASIVLELFGKLLS